MSKSRAKLVCAMPSEEVFRRRQRTLVKVIVIVIVNVDIELSTMQMKCKVNRVSSESRIK